MLASLASKPTPPSETVMPRSVTATRPNHRTALVEVNVNNVGLLRCLNTTLFPVQYKDEFYTDILTVGDLARFGRGGELLWDRDHVD
jgi:hypothetical protein